MARNSEKMDKYYLKIADNYSTKVVFFVIMNSDNLDWQVEGNA